MRDPQHQREIVDMAAVPPGMEDDMYHAIAETCAAIATRARRYEERIIGKYSVIRRLDM